MQAKVNQMSNVKRRVILAAPIALALANASTLEAATFPVVDFVIVFKSARKLRLYSVVDGQPKLLHSYRVDLGFAPRGDKGQVGDGRTPEGTYFIDRRNENSRYYLSLGISYPNVDDVAQARANGVDPGGDIFIHGAANSLRNRFKRDWTAGCISVSNREMDEIWAMVPLGTPIEIRP